MSPSCYSLYVQLYLPQNQSCPQSHNLGQNKIRNKTFFFPKWGEGGLKFFICFDRDWILDRIKWEIKPPSPHINDEFARKPKHAFFFSSLKWGEGGLKFFICFDRDCSFTFGQHEEHDLWPGLIFSLNSRTYGYTVQNQRGEQVWQTSSGFVAFCHEILVGKIGETRHPDQKEIL